MRDAGARRGAPSARAPALPSSRSVRRPRCQTPSGYDRTHARTASILRVFVEQPYHLRIAPALVPWDERDVRGKSMALHQAKQLLKVEQAVRRFQHGSSMTTQAARLERSQHAPAKPILCTVRRAAPTERALGSQTLRSGKLCIDVNDVARCQEKTHPSPLILKP